MGRLHRPEGQADGETPWQVNAELHFPGHRRASGSRGPSRSLHGPKGEAERLAVRRRDAMKYRLAGASYQAIAAKLTEDRANAYADEHGVSFGTLF